MQFKRSIGIWGLLFTGIGSVVGSGWLFGPLFAAQIAGPASIFSWILGGCLMIMIAFTFAELGCAFPVAGGMVQYAQYSHGPLISFITGWMVWLSSIAVAPVETMGLIHYLSNYVPGLMVKVNQTNVLSHNGIILGAAIMFLMCILNYQGARFFSRTNTLVTILKLFVPITTILILLACDFHSSNFISSQSGGFAPFGLKGILAALPLGGVIYSFIGSNTILQLAAETKKPEKYIPLALIGSVIFGILLYSFLQIAFIGALSPKMLISGWNNLHYSGDNGPFAGILAGLGLWWFVMIIYGDAIISPFGTGFIYTAATARVNFGLSKIGFFPSFFQKLTKKGVPTYGLIINYLVGLFLFLPFPAWQSMVSFIISCFIISYIIGPIALIGLRKNQPKKDRPFRLPCVNLFAFVAFYICNLLIFWTGWSTVSKMIVVMMIGFIVFILNNLQNKKNLKQQFSTSWWILPYLSGISLISYWGSFGNGLGLISFGHDFLIIAGFTLVIFVLAKKLVCNDSRSTEPKETLLPVN